MGSDMMYSGTVAGASEAVNLGIKAISISTSPEHYNSVINDLPTVMDFVFSNSLLDKHRFYEICH